MTDKPSKTMLYKHPGPHKIHGKKFDYIITEDIKTAIKDGWSLTTPEALEAGSKTDDNKKPTRDEVKAKADELGLEYAKNIATKKLQKMVEDEIDKLEG